MPTTPVDILARVRGLTEAGAAAPEVDGKQLTLSQQLELLFAQGAAPYQELVRTGLAVKIGTAAAIAGVIALPTTAVMLGLYNNEPDGGRSMIIDWVAALNVASTAVATQAQILLLNGQVREAAPTDAALAIIKMNGLGTKPNVNVSSILNATALPANTGVAANWFPWGPVMIKTGVAATPGYGGQVPVDGRIITPPGRYFAMHVLSSVVGETFLAFVGFHMKQMNLG